MGQLIILFGCHLYLLSCCGFFWPKMANFFYNENKLTKESVSYLGPFGDMFGGLTAFLTLAALLVSSYVNYLQYKQFEDIRNKERLDNHRYIRQSLSESDVMDANYMLQYDQFIYYRDYSTSNLAQGFMDKRIQNDKERKEKSQTTEMKLDKLLMVYEEILLLSEQGMLSEALSIPYMSRINDCTRNRHVFEYLTSLEGFKGENKTIYSRLIKRAKLLRTGKSTTQ